VNDLVPIGKEFLTPAEFQHLADVPPELGSDADSSTADIRRSWRNDVDRKQFMMESPILQRNSKVCFMTHQLLSSICN
jgi:hypothetical protein